METANDSFLLLAIRSKNVEETTATGWHERFAARDYACPGTHQV